MSKFHLGHENKILNSALVGDQCGIIDGAGDNEGSGISWMLGLTVLTQ
jgi:hypothetical protein